MIMKAISICMMMCLIFVFGCASQQHASLKLTEAERSVLENYHASRQSLEQAARICLAHRLTKSEVIRFMGKTMRTEIGDRKVEYFWMPSQILTFNSDENALIVNADLGFKKLSRENVE